MEFNQLVIQRRSCRKFLDEEVKKEDIEKILQTTLLAPSWKNSETGRYYIAISKQAKQVVYDALPDFNKVSSKGASYIIATYKKGLSGCGKEKEYVDEIKDGWGSYDLGLQSAYLCLAAKDNGFDTLIMGLKDNKVLRDYFKIPEDEDIMPVIAIGKANGDLKLNPRKTIEEISTIK